MHASDERRAIRRGYLSGLAAAATFGISAPAAKGLLGEWSAPALAAMLHLGAATALTLVRVARRAVAGGLPTEAALRGSDVPALAVIVVAGGLLGPVLMLLGLQRLSGMVGALCLNLEAPLTILLSVATFDEHLTWREAGGCLWILLGALLLAVAPGDGQVDAVGVLLVGGACLCWALDNNLTQRVSGRDPLAITQVKTLGGGILGLAVAAWSGSLTLPPPMAVVSALLVGAVSYGLSIVLDTHALRRIGAAREAAIFATAPLFGAGIAIVLLGEHPGAVEVLAAVAMTGGVVSLVTVRHEHEHTHAAIEHEHRHTHDLHHAHEHVDEEGRPPHSPVHWHERVTHSHAHVSDVHHRHRHER